MKQKTLDTIRECIERSETKEELSFWRGYISALQAEEAIEDVTFYDLSQRIFDEETKIDSANSPKEEKFQVGVSWDKKTIEYDKSFSRPNSLYPDTVLWGMTINGIMNPNLMTMLEELAKAINQKSE